MSRPFSIALILLGSAIIASLVWLHFHLMGRQHEALFAQAEMIHQEVIVQKIQTLKLQHNTVQEFLSDPIYERRRPALHIFATAEKKLEEYLSTVEQKKGTDFLPASSLAARADYAVQEVLIAAKQTFSGHHEAFDLSEYHLQEILADFDEMAQLGSSYPATNALSEPSAADAFNRDLITISVLTRLSNILEKSHQNSCYRGCWYGVVDYFPIAMSDGNYIKAGKTINLKMAVGSYSNALNPNNVMLIANGDSIRIGPDGTGDYNLRAKSPGKHTILTKCIITNPLTGEVQVGEGTYNYRSY